MRRDSGFTLIEILTVLMITTVLMTLGAFALRGYWQTRSLHGSTDEVVSELRHLQGKTIAESHPLVYGAWFKAGSTNWGVVMFDPEDPAVSGDDTCSAVGADLVFEDGVTVKTVSFEDMTPQTSVCASAVPGGAETVFFFARGTASEGEIVLEHEQVDKTELVTVSDVTGRVERT